MSQPIDPRDAVAGRIYYAEFSDCCLGVEVTRMLVAPPNPESDSDYSTWVFAGDVRIHGWPSTMKEIQ